MPPLLRQVVTVLLLLTAVVSLYNVYSDNSEVVKSAQALACGAAPCVRLLRAERTPLRQSFTFQTSLKPARTRDVSCERAYVLLGEVSCRAAD
jgi:hypothetical protein